MKNWKKILKMIKKNDSSHNTNFVVLLQGQDKLVQKKLNKKHRSILKQAK
jgi:hypothetical protein